MTTRFNEIVFITIPERYYEVLKRWASERDFRSSNQSFTPDKVAAEIVCEFIDSVEQMELKLQPDQAEKQDRILDHGPDSNKGSLPTQA